MAHSQFNRNRPVLSRVGSLVAGCSLLLTFSFLGFVAIVTSDAAGLGGRIPYYVLGAALTFAAALVVLDRHHRDGRDLLVRSMGAAALAFVSVTLGLEGLAFMIRNPGQTIASSRLLYLLAAAMVSTGLGYWVRNHWSELTRSVRRYT